MAPSPATGPTAAAPAPAPSVDEAVKIRAFNWLQGLQSGVVDRSQLSRAFNTALTPKTLAADKAELSQLGKIKGITYDGEALLRVGIYEYQFDVEFATATWTYGFYVDLQDHIAGLFLAPKK